VTVKKGMNKTLKNVLILAAVGVGGWVLYKKVWPMISGAITGTPAAGPALPTGATYAAPLPGLVRASPSNYRIGATTITGTGTRANLAWDLINGKWVPRATGVSTTASPYDPKVVSTGPTRTMVTIPGQQVTTSVKPGVIGGTKQTVTDSTGKTKIGFTYN
jgi:hypothetical protein